MRYYGRRAKLRKQAINGRGRVQPVFPDQLRLAEGMSIHDLAMEIEARQMYQEQEIDAVAPRSPEEATCTTI